jgi:hypothetical protein
LQKCAAFPHSVNQRRSTTRDQRPITTHIMVE